MTLWQEVNAWKAKAEALESLAHNRMRRNVELEEQLEAARAALVVAERTLCKDSGGSAHELKQIRAALVELDGLCLADLYGYAGSSTAQKVGAALAGTEVMG
jgi:hypothetical protein